MTAPANLGHLRSILDGTGNGAQLHVVVGDAEHVIVDIVKTVIDGAEHVVVHLDPTETAATVPPDAPPSPEPQPEPVVPQPEPQPAPAVPQPVEPQPEPVEPPDAAPSQPTQ